jgi:hypothetical protein
MDQGRKISERASQIHPKENHQTLHQFSPSANSYPKIALLKIQYSHSFAKKKLHINFFLNKRLSTKKRQ